METYFNSLDEECVVWTDENGQTHSMLKSVYDEQQAALEDLPKATK
jgi:hypothetical protein